MMNQTQFCVIAIPDSINFYLNDEEGCKQVIEIYNVHDFTINFKVLCTSVENYNVDPSHGSIRKTSKICVTIELKNHDFDRKKDIFKIDAFKKDDNSIIGEKEIIVHILPEKPADLNELNEKEELKATKSDDNLNSYKRKSQLNQPTTITLENAQNLVLLSAGKFAFYLIIVFLFGIFTGMIINAPQDIKLD